MRWNLNRMDMVNLHRSGYTIMILFRQITAAEELLFEIATVLIAMD